MNASLDSRLGVLPAWRSLQTYTLARVLFALALLLSVWVFGTLQVFVAGHGDREVALLSAYLVAASLAAAATLLWQRHFFLQLAGQLSLDLLLISTLVFVGGGMRSGFVIFYLLPLAGAALMLPTSGAFFACSLAVLALLADALLRSLGGAPGDGQIFQAGVHGAALFAITGLLRLLTLRLARQEQLARARGRDLQNQLEINRLVIAQMEQGVVVVDADTRVRANNQAARLLLDLDAQSQLTGLRLADLPALQPLAEGFLAWLRAGEGATGWSPTLLPMPEAGASTLALPRRRLRARFARPPAPSSGEYVIFLDDLQAIERKAQGLKLAAMGRLTASIAHEIRNPLAAISHASQLLAEEVQDPVQLRLTAILRENTRRLSRLVEDVLRVARRDPLLADQFELSGFVAQWLEEFVHDHSLGADLIHLAAPQPVQVKFEQSHLRQVMFNLVENALRYGSGQPGCIEIRIERDAGGRGQLWVIDDGAGVAGADRGAMFEPFYTTRPLGTGLGLFLAREFCVANRAELSYEPLRGGAARTGFVLRFFQGTAGASPGSGLLDLAAEPDGGR